MVTKLDINGQMKKRLMSDFEDFEDIGTVYECPDKLRFIYKDNGSNILAVAHLDTVQGEKHFHAIRIGTECIIYNAQLDDHLGAYVILDLLPEILGGQPFDYLLTEGEETGRSTAKWFKPPEGKKYNWIFQFDRQGDDVVCYDYDDAFLRGKLTSVNFKVGQGSFTDICKLTDLGCKAFNVGTGYHNPHSLFALAYMSELVGNVTKFVRFYEAYKDEHLPHVQAKYKTYPTATYHGSYKYHDTTTDSYSSVNSHWKKKVETPQTADEWMDFLVRTEAERKAKKTTTEKPGEIWYKDRWYTYKEFYALRDAEFETKKKGQNEVDLEAVRQVFSEAENVDNTGVQQVEAQVSPGEPAEVVWCDNKGVPLVCSICGDIPKNEDEANFMMVEGMDVDCFGDMQKAMKLWGK